MTLGNIRFVSNEELVGSAFNYPIVLKSKPECSMCGIEWCETLDAYYGATPGAKDMCFRCRRKQGIR